MSFPTNPSASELSGTLPWFLGQFLSGSCGRSGTCSCQDVKLVSEFQRLMAGQQRMEDSSSSVLLTVILICLDF